MPRGKCHRHDGEIPCTCAMGHLYRFIEPVVLALLQKKGSSYGYDLANELEEHALTDNAIERGDSIVPCVPWRKMAMLRRPGRMGVAVLRGVIII